MGLSRLVFLVEDYSCYNGWLSQLFLRVFATRKCFVGGQVLLASEQLDCYLAVAVYRKSRTYTHHLTIELSMQSVPIRCNVRL